MKVIFLDVDGPLTYSDYQNDTTVNIDIEKVKMLRRIIEVTNAEVVISSSWRGSATYTPKIYYKLLAVLKSQGIDPYGDLPYIELEHDDTSLEENCNLPIAYGTGRAAEIQQWLSEHPEVTSFVILDDEDWNWKDYGYSDNWVRPTWFGDGGLKEEHVKQSIDILLKEEV